MLTFIAAAPGLQLTPRMGGEQVLLKKFGLPGAAALDRRQARRTAPSPF
jgi:hypothetical protein